MISTLAGIAGFVLGIPGRINGTLVWKCCRQVVPGVQRNAELWLYGWRVESGCELREDEGEAVHGPHEGVSQTLMLEDTF